MTFLNHNPVRGRDTLNSLGNQHSAWRLAFLPQCMCPTTKTGPRPSGVLSGKESKLRLPWCFTSHSKILGQGGMLKGAKGMGDQKTLTGKGSIKSRINQNKLKNTEAANESQYSDRARVGWKGRKCSS